MKALLQRRFDLPIQKPIPNIEKTTIASSNKFQGTKSDIYSSWSASFVGDDCSDELPEQCVITMVENKNKLLHSEKDKVVAARPFCSPKHHEQKSATSFADNFSPCKEENKNYATATEQNSFGTKQNVRSSWSESVICDVCPSLLKQQGSLIKPGAKKVSTSAHNMTIMNAEIFTSPKHCANTSASPFAEIFPPPKEHQKVLPSATRIKEVGSTMGSHVLQKMDVQERDVNVYAEISHTLNKQVVQSSCVADSEPPIDIIDDASHGLSMMAREVQSDGTAVSVKGQRSSIFQS